MKEYRTIVVADHHKTVIVCRILDQETGEVRSQSVAGDREQLRALLVKLPGPALVFVEACRAWEWVSDLCEDLEIDFRLVDPVRMPEICRSTKKTDRNDVEAMLARLVATGRLPESHRVKRADRELRDLTRRLTALRKDRRRLLQRIHAVLDSHGLPSSKASFVKQDWRERMQKELAADPWMALESLLGQLDLALEWTAKIEKRVEELVKDRADYRRLQVIPGIGPVVGATILAETQGIGRFPTARKFAAFTGLVPRVRSSAGKSRIGHITRCGPPDLRWALGQAAASGLRAKQSTAVSSMYRRKRKKRKAGRLALCAAAHKLARIVYVILARGDDFRIRPQSA